MRYYKSLQLKGQQSYGRIRNFFSRFQKLPTLQNIECHKNEAIVIGPFFKWQKARGEVHQSKFKSSATLCLQSPNSSTVPTQTRMNMSSF